MSYKYTSKGIVHAEMDKYKSRVFPFTVKVS